MYSEKIAPSLASRLSAAGQEPLDLLVRTRDAPEDCAPRAEALGFRVRHRFRLTRTLALTGPATAVPHLAAEPWVERIEPDEEMRIARSTG